MSKYSRNSMLPCYTEKKMIYWSNRIYIRHLLGLGQGIWRFGGYLWLIIKGIMSKSLLFCTKQWGATILKHSSCKLKLEDFLLSMKLNAIKFINQVCNIILTVPRCNNLTFPVILIYLTNKLNTECFMKSRPFPKQSLTVLSVITVTWLVSQWCVCYWAVKVSIKTYKTISWSKKKKKKNGHLF